MKRKQLSLTIAALLAAGGLWFAWRTPSSSNKRPPQQESGMEADFRAPEDLSKAGPVLNPPTRHAPPDPSRRFRDFTPEDRVKFARRGHGPGG